MADNTIRYTTDGLSLQYVPPITEITISAKATSIYGKASTTYAFFKAKDTIQRVEFEEKPQMESISAFCFYQCSKLSFIDLSKCSLLTSIGEKAFSSCTSLKTINLPNSLTSISSNVFEWSGLTSISLPSSLHNFGSHNFFRCKSLTTCNIHPNSTIEFFTDHQFTGTILVSLELTKTIKYFSGDNFEEVSTIEKITVDPENPYFTVQDNVVFDKDVTKVIYAIPKLKNEYRIPDGVTIINNCAFSSSHLTKVIFPSSLETINGWSFVSASLTELILPENCTTIGTKAFQGCTGLKSIVLNNGLKLIGAYCFDMCTNLATVTLPETIMSIGGKAFPSTTELIFDPKSDLELNKELLLIIDRSKTKIHQCLSSESIISIPNTIKTIGTCSFSEISTLNKVEFQSDSQLTTIQTEAFRRSSIASINLPDSLETISDNAFYGCVNLDNIYFGKKLRAVSKTAFCVCKGLQTLTVSSDGAQISLDYGCFSHCSKLANVDFKNRISFVGSACFEFCAALTSISFSDVITSIDSNAFQYSGLIGCNFPAEVSFTDFEIQTFFHCESLSNITIPEGVVTIKDDAFAFTAIDKVILPKSVQTLNEKCFQGCPNIQQLQIPESSSLKDIGFGAFFNCTLFTVIKNDCKNFKMENQALFNENQTELIILPPNSDCKFFSFPDTLQTVRISALQGCKNLCVIFLPSSVTEIMPFAFSGCINLRSINIPITCTKIGENAFQGCKKLQCGITIESTDINFRKNLIESALMPKRAIEDCVDNCVTIKGTRNFNLAFVLLSYILIGYNSI